MGLKLELVGQSHGIGVEISIGRDREMSNQFDSWHKGFGGRKLENDVGKLGRIQGGVGKYRIIWVVLGLAMPKGRDSIASLIFLSSNPVLCILSSIQSLFFQFWVLNWYQSSNAGNASYILEWAMNEKIGKDEGDGSRTETQQWVCAVWS